MRELFKTVDKEKFMRFTDYNGRKLMMAEDVFKNHTKGKYLNPNEQRHQLFPHIKDILKTPDEVWMNKHKKEQFQNFYIKFYKNETVLINTKMSSKMEGIEVNSWYLLKDLKENQRKELLIKKGKDL